MEGCDVGMGERGFSMGVQRAAVRWARVQAGEMDSGKEGNRAVIDDEEERRWWF